MALSILDGNQSATTLSTILSSGQHITAHTVVSLGTQAITDIVNATSAGLTNNQLRASAVTIAGTVTVGNSITIGASSVTFNSYVAKRDDGTWQSLSVETGSGYVSARVYPSDITPFTATVTIGNSVTISSGTVTLGASTAQIGSVTASGTVTANIGGIANSVTLPVRLFAEKFGEAPSGQDTLLVCNSSGMLLVDANSGGSSVLGYDGNAFVQVKQVSGSSVTIGNSVTISSLPAISGTVTANNNTIDNYFGLSLEEVGEQDATFAVRVQGSSLSPLPISGSVTANTFAVQGTAVTTSNFTSTTASTVLASFNATREVLTIFNEGAGNLHICAGATCTTIAYQVRLSAGDYYEVPNHQTSLTHSAVFATAGTARICQVS